MPTPLDAAVTALVDARLGRDLTDDDSVRLNGLIEDALILVSGWCGQDFTDPVPDTVAIVMARMVARVLSSPSEVTGLESTQLSAGSFQLSRNFTADSVAGGPWLSKSDRVMLRRFRRGVTNVSMW